MAACTANESTAVAVLDSLQTNMSSSYFIYALALALPLLYLLRRRSLSPTPPPPRPPVTTQTDDKNSLKTIMQAPRNDIDTPKNDPFTLSQLAEYDGSDASKPIYVSIKGDVFDVTRKRDVYGSGGSYNIFAGKDGSKGLGMSSLKPEDAVPDYSALPENERKVLDDWHSFFMKRYNIVGRVTDMPEAVASLSSD
ncbi:cytochrome b5 [Boletus reticuloceps]|uniref:Cytochrome b5 n=1 Tax=Boletus reticuloceps TaxID=495285 RepID=A0A8I2YQE3_9AGAM|nr:cytochrome b5 [Boletus reticuloceps]